MINEQTVVDYLVSRGVPRPHAIGMAWNIADESSFNPTAVGDGGKSYGLFQHYADRRDALFRHAGTNTPSWQQQIDYALSEPDTKRYLSQDFANPGEAASWFVEHWERPAAKHRIARQRKYLERGGIDPRTAGTEGAGPAVSPYTLPDRWDQTMQMPPQAPRQTTLQDTLPPELLQLLQGEQSKPNPWQMLGALGAGILSSGGGPGAGNWMAQGVTNALNVAGQQRKNDLFAAQTQLGIMKLLGLQEPSASERVRGRETRHFLDPTTGRSVTLELDAYSGQYLHPLTGDPMSPQETAELIRGMVPVDRPPNPGELGMGASRGGSWDVREAPDGSMVRVNPQTGAVEMLMEAPPQAESGRVGTPTAAMKEAQFLYPDDPEAQREHVRQKQSEGRNGGSADVAKLDAAISQVEALDAIMFGDEEKKTSGAFTTGDNKDVSGFWGRAFKGIENLYNDLTQKDMTAELYDRQLASIAGTLAKAFGDAGTLSEGDVKRALRAMPSAGVFPDSTAYARAAKDHLLAVLKEKRAVAAGEIAPQTESLLPPDKQSRLDELRRKRDEGQL